MSIIKQNIHLGFAKPELINYLKYMWSVDSSDLGEMQEDYMRKYRESRKFPSEIKYANIMDLQPKFELFSEYESLLTLKEAGNMIENKIPAFNKYDDADNIDFKFEIAKKNLYGSYSLFIDTLEDDYNVIECDENQYEIVCDKINTGMWKNVIAIICHDSSRMKQKTYNLPNVLLTVFYVEKPNDMSISLKTVENFPFVHSNLVFRGSGGYSISIDDGEEEDSADIMNENYNNRISFKSNISEQIRYHNQGAALMSSGDIPNYPFITFALNPESGNQKFYSSQHDKIYIIYGTNVMKDSQPRDNYDGRREIEIRKNDLMLTDDVLASVYIIFPDLSREEIKSVYKNSQKILTPDKHDIENSDKPIARPTKGIELVKRNKVDSKKIQEPVDNSVKVSHAQYCQMYFEQGKSIVESLIDHHYPDITNKLETVVNIENFLGSNIMRFKPYSRGDIMVSRASNSGGNEKTNALGEKLLKELIAKYEPKTLDEKQKIFQRMDRVKILLATNKNIDPIFIKENICVREEDKLAIDKGILKKNEKHVFGPIEETYEYHGDIFCKISSRKSVKIVFKAADDYPNDIYVTDIDLLCIVGLGDNSEVVPRVHVHGFVNTLIVTGKVDVIFDTISEIDKSNISNIYDQMRDYEDISDEQVNEYIESAGSPVIISTGTRRNLPEHIKVGGQVTRKRSVIRNFFLLDTEKRKRWGSAYIMNKNFE